jgi:hypothetical protein
LGRQLERRWEKSRLLVEARLCRMRRICAISGRTKTRSDLCMMAETDGIRTTHIQPMVFWIAWMFM